MNSKLNTNPDDLIHNPEFFEWVVRPTKELDQYWNQFISVNPSRKKEAKEAIFIINSIIPKEEELTDEAILRLWNRIEFDTNNQINSRIQLTRWMAAASIILLLGISGLLYFQFNQTANSGIDYLSIAKINIPDKEVKLIFSDKSEELLNSQNLDIKYTSKGDIEINSKKNAIQKTQDLQGKTEQMNQLVVPYGKRTSLTLSDGTRLWLNSGSRAIFPVIFKNKEREIFIEGEAYVEVAHDPAKPFFVISNKIHVKVLGTKFNISAYPEDKVASVVLVEGSVNATVGEEKRMMKPNQLLTYVKSSGSITLNDTDILPFISWKYGWMHCRREKLETIVTRLSRYYNVQIEFKDPQTKELTLTGKLDLKTECSEIFKVISSTAPISFKIQNNVIIISDKSEK